MPLTEVIEKIENSKKYLLSFASGAIFYYAIPTSLRIERELDANIQQRNLPYCDLSYNLGFLSSVLLTSGLLVYDVYRITQGQSPTIAALLILGVFSLGNIGSFIYEKIREFGKFSQNSDNSSDHRST